MKFLFWNTHKNVSINQIICKIAREKDIDIIFLAEYDDNSINFVLSELIMENHISIAILAEYTANMQELIEILASNNIIMKQYYSGCDRIKLLGSPNSVEPRLDTDHATIQI